MEPISHVYLFSAASMRILIYKDKTSNKAYVVLI